ncbi:MAG TPA: hypothetical protein VHS96_05370, partial [Bacteroidia bacterium]|nr:hypothetical protein [Bacteroidia bacterium]
ESELAALKAELIKGNHALMARFPEWIDLKIEAAALLQAAGERVPETWIDGLIQAQQADGGWRKDMHQPESTTHATILALWLLAESR